MDGIKAAAVGRLVRDAELRHVKGGELAVCSFTLAVDGKDADDTQWLRVSLWAERAEELAPKLKKGAEVYVEGKLSLGAWTGQDGTQRHGLNLSAWRCHVLADFQPPAGRSRRPRGELSSGTVGKGTGRPGPGAQEGVRELAELAGAVGHEFDDEIPF